MTIAPSKVLGEIQMMLVAELVSQPSAIVLSRPIVSIVQAALGEIIGQIEVLEEGSAAADRLAAEMTILEADRERWRTAAETYRAAWVKEARRSPVPLLRFVGGGEVVDLTEVLRRERRDAGRPIGPEGGAA